MVYWADMTSRSFIFNELRECAGKVPNGYCSQFCGCAIVRVRRGSLRFSTWFCAEAVVDGPRFEILRPVWTTDSRQPSSKLPGKESQNDSGDCIAQDISVRPYPARVRRSESVEAESVFLRRTSAGLLSLVRWTDFLQTEYFSQNPETPARAKRVPATEFSVIPPSTPAVFPGSTARRPVRLSFR